MKSKSSKFSSLATLVSVLLAGTAAHASISITNHSFEEPAVGDGATSTSITGWAQGSGGIFNTQDAQVTGTTYVDPGTPGLIPGGDGVQVAFMNGSSPMNQNIGMIEANNIYELTVAIGERLGFGWSDLTVSLRAGSSTGTVLASATYTAADAPNGSFTDVSFSFSSADFAGEVGNSLFVTFQTVSAQSLYDNVRVTESAIPAPAAFSLAIAPNASNPGNYDFTWDSQDGKIYDLVSSTDLSTAPATWAVWDGRADIAGTAPENTLTNIPGGGDPKRFFVVIENDP